MPVNRERFSHFSISSHGSDSPFPSPAFSRDGDFVPLRRRPDPAGGARPGHAPLGVTRRGLKFKVKGVLAIRHKLRKTLRFPKLGGEPEHEEAVDRPWLRDSSFDMPSISEEDEPEEEDRDPTCPEPIFQGVPTFRVKEVPGVGMERSGRSVLRVVGADDWERDEVEVDAGGIEKLPSLLPITGGRPMSVEPVIDEHVWRVLQYQPRRRLDEKKRIEMGSVTQRGAGLLNRGWRR